MRSVKPTGVRGLHSVHSLFAALPRRRRLQVAHAAPEALRDCAAVLDCANGNPMSLGVPNADETVFKNILNGVVLIEFLSSVRIFRPYRMAVQTGKDMDRSVLPATASESVGPSGSAVRAENARPNLAPACCISFVNCFPRCRLSFFVFPPCGALFAV